uniref:Ankyrin n=1 Tax=Anopheles gambiae TaxID=7165 RepID=A0A1S4GZ44_ANOGA
MLLFESVQNGDLDQVRHLLDGGADVNARDDKFFNTALHRAVFARRNRLELVALLIERGADCNALNKKRLTAAELALENRLPEVAKQLVLCETAHLDDHLAYYLLIRRGNLQLFEYLISIKRLRYEDEICVIARAYGELRLRNVPLSEPMESYLTEILINHDYWLRNRVRGGWADGRRETLRRLGAIVENVQELTGGYDSHNLTDVDSLFLLRLSHILENLFFVRNAYKQLPLHHLEFCIGDSNLSVATNSPEESSTSAGTSPTTSLSPGCEQFPKAQRKFHWTTERNRELMFCHYVVTGSGEHTNYRARLHELWVERHRALEKPSIFPATDEQQPALELTEQNLLTQQRKIVRDQLLPEDVRRRVETEAISYRYYLRTSQPKVSDKNRKVFRKLACCYRRIRELHATNRALEYIDSVSELEWSGGREIETLAMKRVVQVVCETVRHGRDTPIITKHLESFVNVLTTERILGDARVRDYLSHYRRGNDLFAILTGATGSSDQKDDRRDHLHINADALDCEELHRNLKLLRHLFRNARNLQHIMAIKTLINRLYDSKSLEEIKSYHAYLFRHSPTGALLDELDWAPFGLLEIDSLVDAIEEEYHCKGVPANDHIQRIRAKICTELASYKTHHRQFSNTILLVEDLIAKIKSNHSYEKIRHIFRSHLKAFQRNRAIDMQFLVHLRSALLKYFYDDLPELRHRNELERRIAMLLCRCLYAIDRKLYHQSRTSSGPLTVHLTGTGNATLLKRLEEATGRQLSHLTKDPLFCKLQDHPEKRYDLLRQLLNRHHIRHSTNLLADLRRDEERETEEKVAQLQKLFLDQNMNMRPFERIDEIAFEMLMLEATCALSAKLADNRESVCNYLPVLTGRNLRNYLAHGHVTYEALIPCTGPKTILLNALSIIKLSKNIISEIYDRHGWEFSEKLALLKHQQSILGGFQYQSCSAIRDTIRQEAYLLGRNHLNHGIVDHLVQQQSCMLLGHLLDFGKVDEFLKPLAYLMESVSAIPCGRPLHAILADTASRVEFCYSLAVLSNDEDILSKIVADFGYGQIDAIPMVFNFDRLFASFLETHPDYDVNADANAEILHYAVLSGNVELLNLLLDQCHDLNQRDEDGQTPLEVACKLSNVEMVKALTNAGARWYTNGEHGYSQYSWIFLNNDQDAIVFLKNNELLSGKVAGACVTLFLQYCDDGNEEIVEFMLANETVEYGALYPATVRFRRLNVLRFLIESDRKVSSNVNRKEGSMGLTPLQIAARMGYADVAKILLEQGAKVQLRDAHGNSALHYAVECGCVKTVRLLLRHGASVGVRNSLGQSPLEIAIAREHRKLVRLLAHSGQKVDSVMLPERLRNGAIVEDLLPVAKRFEYSLSPGDVSSDTFTPLHHARDERAIQQFLQLYEIDVASPRYRTTPLHLACLSNDPLRVRALLKHGADPTLANSEGRTPLLLAVGNRSTSIVQTLLEHRSLQQARPTTHDELDTVLAIAIRKQSIEIANLLLQKGASIDTIGRTLTALSPTHRGISTTTTPKHPHQLFFCAARDGYNRILEYLLEGALFDVNAKDTIGSTALFHALSRAPLDTLDILLRYGADVEHSNQFGHNVLSIAAMNNRLDALQYFVNNFPTLVRLLDAVEVDTKNSVLHLAVLRGALEIVQYCVKLHRTGGISLDAQNKEGFTALHISAQTGHEAIFGYLLSHGANATIPSANGQSILHTAICNRNLNIVQIIHRAGVLPLEQDLFDHDERSPLHYAVLSRQVEVVREVLKLPGLPLNHADARGNTALHLAAEFQYVDIYNLLQKRIDNEVRNGNGKRAIDVLLRK